MAGARIGPAWGLCALAGVLAGCALLQRTPTPQQRFIAALSRGNGAQAASIWRAMTPQQRLEFARSQGVTASAPESEVRDAVLRTLQEKYPSPGQEQAELPALDAPKASLFDLPSYAPKPDPNSAPP